MGKPQKQKPRSRNRRKADEYFRYHYNPEPEVLRQHHERTGDATGHPDRRLDIRAGMDMRGDGRMDV